MKILIDTNNKTIKIESNSTVGEIVEKLSKMLPDWKEYKIIPNVKIETKFIEREVLDPFKRKPFTPYYTNNDLFKIADDPKKGYLIEVDERGKETIKNIS